MRNRSKFNGFTLIEVLVVIAIIGIMVAILLPAVQMAREAARRMACENNLKNMGLALHNYHDTVRAFPFGFDEHETLWTAMILPQLEQSALYGTLLFSESGAGNWDASGSANQKACATLVPVFRCPSMLAPEHMDDAGIPNRVPISYRGVSGNNAVSDDASTIPAGFPSVALEQQMGLNGAFFGCSAVRMGFFSDGLSNTVLIGETRTDVLHTIDGQRIDVWAFGGPQTGGWSRTRGDTGGTEYSEALGSTFGPINAEFRQDMWPRVVSELCFGSYHNSGAHFVLGDGSVRFISEDIDLNTYRALGSINGGEVVAEF